MIKTTLFHDHTGKHSSTRVVFVIVVITVVFTWAYVSITTRTIAPWPLDDITSAALLSVTSLKTFVEKYGKDIQKLKDVLKEEK